MDPNELLEKARSFLHGPFDRELLQEILRESSTADPSTIEVLNDLLEDYLKGLQGSSGDIDALWRFLRGGAGPEEIEELLRLKDLQTRLRELMAQEKRAADRPRE